MKSFSVILCSLQAEGIKEEVEFRVSVYLDGVKKWNNLDEYPNFNTLVLVPDPEIEKFPDFMHILKTQTLEIKVY